MLSSRSARPLSGMPCRYLELARQKTTVLSFSLRRRRPARTIRDRGMPMRVRARVTLSAALLVLGRILAGCASLPRPQVLDSSSATPTYRVECTDDPAACVAAAAAQCPDGPRSTSSRVFRRSDSHVYRLDFDCPPQGAYVDEAERPKVSDWGTDDEPVVVTTERAATKPEPANDRGRTVLRALGAGLRGFAAGYSAGASTPQSPAPSGCTSDYACGLGFMCSKRMGAMVGECMRAVNPSGSPTYERDPSGHMGAGTNQCAQGCPAGFRCDFGRCVK